jgi:hypothetical protein
MMACGRRSPVPWEDAFYGELPKPTRIGHSIGHQVQQLLPDGNSELTILGVIAKGIIRLNTFQMAANAWSITASVLGAYKLILGVREIIVSLRICCRRES